VFSATAGGGFFTCATYRDIATLCLAAKPAQQTLNLAWGGISVSSSIIATGIKGETTHIISDVTGHSRLHNAIIPRASLTGYLIGKTGGCL
jgi:hypothetical protein